MAKEKFTTVDQYFNSLSADTKNALQELRDLIHAEVPELEEVISYQIPAFCLGKNVLIYIAGYAKHVSMYPVHPDEFAFGKEVDEYMSGKATAQFPLNKPLPVDLIRK